MQIQNYPFTDIYRKNEAGNLISLIFLNKHKPLEALAFLGFSFYLINITTSINLDGFTQLLTIEESNSANEPELQITAINSTDINDIVYIKISNDNLIILTHTFDNYSGDSYQHLRIITKESNQAMPPLGITEYKKFNMDFESGNSCDVLDLRFTK